MNPAFLAKASLITAIAFLTVSGSLVSAVAESPAAHQEAALSTDEMEALSIAKQIFLLMKLVEEPLGEGRYGGWPADLGMTKKEQLISRLAEKNVGPEKLLERLKEPAFRIANAAGNDPRETGVVFYTDPQERFWVVVRIDGGGKSFQTKVDAEAWGIAPDRMPSFLE